MVDMSHGIDIRGDWTDKIVDTANRRTNANEKLSRSYENLRANGVNAQSFSFIFRNWKLGKNKTTV